MALDQCLKRLSRLMALGANGFGNLLPFSLNRIKLGSQGIQTFLCLAKLGTLSLKRFPS